MFEKVELGGSVDFDGKVVDGGVVALIILEVELRRVFEDEIVDVGVVAIDEV